jgi:hypothetical protein
MDVILRTVYPFCIQDGTIIAIVYIMVLPSGKIVNPVAIWDNLYIHRGIHFAERKNPEKVNMC